MIKQDDQQQIIKILSELTKKIWTQNSKSMPNAVSPDDSISNVVVNSRASTPSLHRAESASPRVHTTKSWISSSITTSSSRATGDRRSLILTNALKPSARGTVLQLAMVLLPLVIILGLSGMALYQSWASKLQMDRFLSTITDGADANVLVQLIEAEEEAACAVVVSKGTGRNMLSANEMLRQATENTNHAMIRLQASWDSLFLGSLDNVMVSTQAKNKLTDVRTRINQLTQCGQVLDLYQQVSHPFITAVVHHFGYTEKAKICQYIISFQMFHVGLDAFATLKTGGHVYFDGALPDKAGLTAFHEATGRLNALVDGSLESLNTSKISLTNVSWHAAFAEEQPQVFRSVKSVRSSAERLLDSVIQFQQIEMQSLIGLIVFAGVVCPSIAIAYALFVRHSRMQIVGVASKIGRQSKAIQLEKTRTVQLLNHMLPRHVVESLQHGNPVVPESYQSVTIMFADIIGFGVLVHSTTPDQIVNILNTYYASVDEAVEMHNCYKVEIVNDCVVISSGVPYRCGHRHSDEIVSVALDILMMVTNNGLPHVNGEHLLLRMGIHTGPCSSGVVGSAKPKFCLFGDAVNTSSRMMSTSDPMCIHISGDTHEHLQRNARDQYTFDERPQRFVKGKGMMTTYWVTGKNDHPYTINIKDAAKTMENTTYHRKRVVFNDQSTHSSVIADM